MKGAWWRIGWRNLGRNRRRTLITSLGLALGYLAVVVMAGLSQGGKRQQPDGRPWRDQFVSDTNFSMPSRSTWLW